MTAQRGEIVLVDYPFSDQTGSKVRPALVVQDDAWNKRWKYTILAVITSSRRRVTGAATQFVLTQSDPEFGQSGLRMDSLVQCEILVTYEQSRILRTLGRLSEDCMRQIDVCLKSTFGIP